MEYQAVKEETLSNFLQKIMSGISKRKLKNILTSKRVLINGQICLSASKKIHKGQLVTILPKVHHLPLGLRILYEDSHFVAIDKPCGLLSVATKFEKEHTAHRVLKNHKQQMVYPVHRLDQDTSGVMIFAYTPFARDYFKEILFSHEIYREYLAIVEGNVEKDSGIWQSYLYEDATFFVRSTKNPHNAKWAVTKYSVIERRPHTTKLRIVLETGRKNQIRVHCSENGHPVIGDKKYGSKVNSLGRMALHAHRLTFAHPASHKEMAFTSPVTWGKI